MPLLFSLLAFLTACVSCAYIYSGCCIVYRPPVRSDGFGYYAYLPAIFIDQDLSMKTALANRWTVVGNHPPPYAWSGIARYGPTGKFLDKYTLGTALLQVPFFMVAHTIARVADLPPYSAPYQIANILSGITALALGAFLLFRLLSLYVPVSIATLTCAAITFGTNVFHYATFDGSFSHVYSFFLVTLLLTLGEAYRTDATKTEGPRFRHSLGLGATVGLIALTRVPNVITAIIPLTLVCERFYHTRNARTFCLEVAAGLGAFFLLFGLQMAYWHAVTGSFLLNSYQGEDFNWVAPQIVNFLFSMRKGLFIWSPVLVLAVIGLPAFLKMDKVLGLAVCTVLSLDVYICASWWSWWFGGGFGSRPFVDMMPLMALPLAYGIGLIGAQTGRAAPAAAVAILILFNLFLTVSFWNELVPWDGAVFSDLVRLPAKWVHHH